jgi:hypothetical protein
MLQAQPQCLHPLSKQLVSSNPADAQSLVITTENPFFGRREWSSGDSCQLLLDDLFAEKVEIEIVLVVAEGVFDLGAYGCESDDDVRGNLSRSAVSWIQLGETDDYGGNSEPSEPAVELERE